MENIKQLDSDVMALLKACSIYCERTGKAPATVATQVANDGKFFDRIEAGGGITTRTKKKVLDWFRENTPPPNEGNDIKTK